MKPEYNKYKVRYNFDEFKWQVFTPYKLMNYNELTPIGPKFETLKEAVAHLKTVYANNLSEYESCRKQGCSFPYND